MNSKDKKIHINDIPENFTIFEFLKKEFNIVERQRKKHFDKIFFRRIKDFENLKEIVFSLLDELEIYKWNNNEIENYSGVSLTYNKKIDVNPYIQTLGENNFKNNLIRKKFSYSDSLSFCYFNYAGERIFKFLKEIFDEFNYYQIIRSRIAILHGEKIIKGIWHRDESPYECLRLIVPIQTNKNYFFQLEGFDPVNLEEGKLYWFNGKILHRFFNIRSENFYRIHLIIGINPLFSFDEKEEVWFLNKKYDGEVEKIKRSKFLHPLEIFNFDDYIDLRRI